jgi:hypothetical protein
VDINLDVAAPTSLNVGDCSLRLVVGSSYISWAFSTFAMAKKTLLALTALVAAGAYADNTSYDVNAGCSK